MENSLINFGDKVKVVGKDGKIKACVAVFTGPNDLDFDGEYFDATTNFGVTKDTVLPMLYDHGLDPIVGEQVIGKWTEFEADEFGLWAIGYIDKRNKYGNFLYEQALNGNVQVSGGTKKARMVGNKYIDFLAHEFSLTGTPCGYKTSVIAVKTFKEDISKSIFNQKLQEISSPYIRDVTEALISSFYQIANLDESSEGTNVTVDSVGLSKQLLADFNAAFEKVIIAYFGGASEDSEAAKNLKDLNVALRASMPLSFQVKAARDAVMSVQKRLSGLNDKKENPAQKANFQETYGEEIAQLTADLEAITKSLNELTASVEPTDSADEVEALKAILEFQKLQLGK